MTVELERVLIEVCPRCGGDGVDLGASGENLGVRHCAKCDVCFNFPEDEDEPIKVNYDAQKRVKKLEAALRRLDTCDCGAWGSDEHAPDCACTIVAYALAGEP